MNLVARILYPVGCLWFVLFVLTKSLRIDEKGICALYAFFQKELWVSSFIEWENLEKVKFVKRTHGILIVPMDKKVSLWSSNMIAAAREWYNFEQIVPLLLEHGVTLPPGLMVEMQIEPNDAQTMAGIEAYKVEKAKDDKISFIFNLICVLTVVLAGVVAYMGMHNGSSALDVTSIVICFTGFTFAIFFLIKNPTEIE